MDCNSIKELLSRYADHEVSEREKTQVDSHTRNCPSCAAILHEYATVNELLVAPEPIEASPWLWTRIRQRVADSRTPRRVGILARLRPVLIPVAGAAAVVVAIVAAGQLTQTINVTSRDRASDMVNLRPEDDNSPVLNQSVTPDSSAEDDTLDFEQ